MRLQNNYIFLLQDSSEKKSSTQTKSDGTVVLKLHQSFDTTFDRCFENIHRNKEESTPFCSLFSVDVNETNCTANIITFTVEKNVYLNLTVEAKTKAQAIKILESLHKQIFDCDNIKKDYIPIVSYDSVSEYYCNKLYPKINRMERLLRRLCFNIYILNFGTNYYQATIQGEIQERAKKNMRKKSEIYRLQLFFYSLDFSDIEKILFTPQWLDSEETKRCEILKNKDLSQLTDKELREAFEDIKPKSDWERFFSAKMPKINAYDLIHQIHNYRNSVAHSKFLNNEDYVLCNKLLNKLIKSIEKAIIITEEEDFAERTFGKLQASLARVAKVFEDFNKMWTTSIDIMTKSATIALDRLTKIKIPDIKIPDIKIPEFNFPNYTLPNFNLPTFNIPQYNWDNIFNKLNFDVPTYELPDDILDEEIGDNETDCDDEKTVEEGKENTSDNDE